MKITENTIEEFAIELLERLGYQYIYAPDSEGSLSGVERRNSYEDVFKRILKEIVEMKKVQHLTKAMHNAGNVLILKSLALNKPIAINPPALIN